MFCGECGAKNNPGDLFCQECGKPLAQDQIQNNAANAVSQPRQPMSKKSKIIIAVIIAVAVVLGAGYKIGSDMTNPKAIVKDYVKAVFEGDSDRLYKYLELDGDKTFVSKAVFKEAMGDELGASDTISNYKITDVEYGENGLTAKVKLVYTEKESTSEKTDYINLVKEEEKKFLIFDSWKISDFSTDSMIVKDYEIKVNKGSIITFSGIKVDGKYLNKKESDSTYDVYVLPQVFNADATLKAKLSNGLELEDEVSPSKYYNSCTLLFDEDNLTTESRNKLTTKSKEFLTTIYNNAIEGKQFSEIKTNFEHGNLDLTNLETNYNSFVSDLAGASSKLTSITFTDVSLYDVGLDENGNFEVELKVNYNYTVSYIDSWNDEVKTHTSSDYDYPTLVFAYDKGEFYLVDFDDLEDYFSRYF